MVAGVSVEGGGRRGRRWPSRGRGWWPGALAGGGGTMASSGAVGWGGHMRVHPERDGEINKSR